MIFFLIGFMGSGKTHWGKIWSAKFAYHFIDLDEEIEKIEGKTIADIFEFKGEAYFRKVEAATLRSIPANENTIVSCGGGTPCFYENISWMNNNGSSIYLSTTPAEILERVIAETDKRPLIKKMNPAELLFFIEKTLKDRAEFYNVATITVLSNKLTEQSFINFILPQQSIS